MQSSPLIASSSSFVGGSSLSSGVSLIGSGGYNTVAAGYTGTFVTQNSSMLGSITNTPSAEFISPGVFTRNKDYSYSNSKKSSSCYATIIADSLQGPVPVRAKSVSKKASDVLSTMMSKPTSNNRPKAISLNAADVIQKITH